MTKIKNKFLLSYLLILLIPFSNANLSEEYKNEFSIEGERCEIKDAFIYDFLDTKTTFPVFYNCCNDKSCTLIIFDVNHRTFLNYSNLEEIIDLNFIRSNLYNGTISQNYFQVEGIDLCNYFGFKDVEQQNLNLVSEVVESKFSSIEKSRDFKQISKSIKIAKKIGIVGKFNPLSLVTGVSCGYDNKKLNLAIERLELSNAYLNNIHKGYTKQGYVENLTNSMSVSKNYLEKYIISPVAISRGFVNWILNCFKFLFQISLNSTKNQEIEETEYQIAGKILKEISSYNFSLSNPEKKKIIQEVNNRANMKTIHFNETYLNFTKEYKNISSYKPSYFKILFINIFFTPNYNLSSGIDCLDVLSSHKKMAEEYYSQYKFNSAINSISNLDSFLNCSKENFIRENSVERSFDKIWILIILLLFCIGYVFYEIIKLKQPPNF